MAKRQQEGRVPEQHPSPNPLGGLDVLISEPRISQAHLNPARDDQRDSTGIETVSNSSATTNAARFDESIRNTHQFTREVNGRYYNAQNTLYFLPAGELPNFSTYSSLLYSQLSRVCNRLLHAFLLRFFPDQSLTTFQIKSSMVACEYSTPGASFVFATTLFVQWQATHSQLRHSRKRADPSPPNGRNHFAV